MMTIVGVMDMKEIAAGKFKTHCLAVIDEVYAKHETVVITKHGKPMAKLVPIQQAKDPIFGFMRGKGKIIGDIVSPITPLEDWESLK
ncbi:MAG TPA: type II toxin-antitoxin system prevent-host-death family antitoxin [Alloacidobacterium sp.]|nr:type II toxin-antitoxin system prevent-host-death family antitoxin [Alloacidobacterium sp.]